MMNPRNHLSRLPGFDGKSNGPVTPLRSYLIFSLVMLFLATWVCEAPLKDLLFKLNSVRFLSDLLFNLNLVSLIYIKDLIVIIIVLLFVIRSAYLGVFPNILVYLFIIFVFHSIVAYYYGVNLFMIAFGWKIMLNIVFGVAAYSIISFRIHSAVRYFTIFLLIALAGVYINYFVEFPWEGSTYFVGEHLVEGAREWTGWGLDESVKRIAGFARASFNAAIQIMLFGLFVLTSYTGKFWIKVILWILIIIAIVLTNAKGLILSCVCLSIFFILYNVLPTKRRLFQYLLFSVIVIACALPIFGELLGISQINNYLAIQLLASLAERIEFVWPDAFNQVYQKGNILLGRGMGGFGQPQVFFEFHEFNPGDNIFVYAYGYFGVFSLIYFYYIYQKSKIIDLNTDMRYYVIIAVTFIYGIVSSILEDPVFAFFLGLALGHITEDKKVTDPKSLNSTASQPKWPTVERGANSAAYSCRQ